MTEPQRGFVLVLILTVCAHTAVMAPYAGATGLARVAPATHGQAAPRLVVPSRTDEGRGAAPPPGHVSGCRVVPSVLPSGGDVPCPALIATLVTAAFPETATAPNALWAPALSPRIQRALLQVFLI